ncbi:MAG TPA: DinB family protein [Acidimicrobiales bacterium]|nr:DinB family protein [Acidimicrobiales bacterium]
MVGDIEDPRRVEPPYDLADRAMLEQWLEFHRTTLLLKCEGLDDAGRKRRPVGSSLLSLHGLVRHMSEVERNWFQRVLQRDPSIAYIYSVDGRDDNELFPLDQAGWETDLAIWQAECEASRRAAADRDLSDTGLRHGQPVSLRWIYTHMIEEYARHNGHADLIREMVDGAVGW